MDDQGIIGLRPLTRWLTLCFLSRLWLDSEPRDLGSWLTDNPMHDTAWTVREHNLDHIHRHRCQPPTQGRFTYMLGVRKSTHQGFPSTYPLVQESLDAAASAHFAAWPAKSNLGARRYRPTVQPDLYS